MDSFRSFPHSIAMASLQLVLLSMERRWSSSFDNLSPSTRPWRSTSFSQSNTSSGWTHWSLHPLRLFHVQSHVFPSIDSSRSQLSSMEDFPREVVRRSLFPHGLLDVVSLQSFSFSATLWTSYWDPFSLAVRAFTWLVAIDNTHIWWDEFHFASDHCQRIAHANWVFRSEFEASRWSFQRSGKSSRCVDASMVEERRLFRFSFQRWVYWSLWASLPWSPQASWTSIESLNMFSDGGHQLILCSVCRNTWWKKIGKEWISLIISDLCSLLAVALVRAMAMLIPIVSLVYHRHTKSRCTKKFNDVDSLRCSINVPIRIVEASWVWTRQKNVSNCLSFARRTGIYCNGCLKRQAGRKEGREMFVWSRTDSTDEIAVSLTVSLCCVRESLTMQKALLKSLMRVEEQRQDQWRDFSMLIWPVDRSI